MANRCEIMEIVTNFIFLGSKITTDGDCSHEVKRCLLLGEKKRPDETNSILKIRDITLPTKVHIANAVIFPVVMYGHWDIYRGLALCQALH